MNIEQYAEKSIYNVNAIEKFNAEQLLIVNGVSDRRSSDYYNLIVYGCEPWFKKQNHITFTRDRVLDYYIEPELRARYASLSQDAIHELKTFFCIFAYENTRGRWTNPDQEAAVGHLTEIKKRSNGIEIYFYPLFSVNQQRLNDLSFELGIIGSKGINELSHTHWTVKEINLIEVLQDNGMLRF